MKRKIKGTHHKQNQRNKKKYKGAAAQSKKDSEKSNNYKPAIDYLTGYNANISSLSIQLGHLTSIAYQPALLNAISGMHRKLSSFEEFEAKLPKFDFFDSHSSAFDLSRLATRAYAGLSNMETVSNLALAATKNYHKWYDETIAKSSMLLASSYSAIDNELAGKVLAENFGIQNISAFSVQSCLAKATEYSLFTEKSLSAFSWESLGKNIDLSDTSKEVIGNSFLEVSTKYSTLLKSFEANPSTYIELSPSLVKLAPVEYYTSANLLELISIEEDVTTEEELLKNEIQYENEFSLNTHLPKVHSGLLNMWKGAIETYNSTNSDRVRHFTISLRELFTHLIHLLAPDNEITKWTKDVIHFHEGKPTRKARLHYICRNISNKPFNKFVDKDIQATVEFINIFQEGTHGIDSEFSPQQLIALKSKAETTLKFLLEIEFSTNR